MLFPIAALLLAGLGGGGQPPAAPPPANPFGRFVKPYAAPRGALGGQPAAIARQLPTPARVCSIPLRNVLPRNSRMDRPMVVPTPGRPMDPKMVVAPPAPACDDGR